MALCFTKSVSTPLWSNQRGISPPTDRWSCGVVCCVCVRVCVCVSLSLSLSACIWMRILGCGGKGSGVWGGRGGGEVWGEVSGGTAGETPTPTSCCLKRARQQPACPPACLYVLAPLLLFLILSCRPLQLSLCPVPLQTQPSCSRLSTLHPCHYAP